MLESVETHLVDYKDTGKFSRIVTDYIEGSFPKQLYEYPVSIEGIRQSILNRSSFTTNRELLVSTLKKQYTSVSTSLRVQQNIQALLNANTFTICTAHQPNIFTGHLYFIYKILHAIKLADALRSKLPGHNFVPVFYMGSEDADLEELGQIYLSGEKKVWQTKQKGAVGRMLVDQPLLELIDQISGQLTIHPYGSELIDLIRICYAKGNTIELATFKLIHSLFERYGLIVLLPDCSELKQQMISVFQDDIFNNTPSKLVKETSLSMGENYKVQAHAREINLFYLDDGIRNRISKDKQVFKVENTALVFSEDELRNELSRHPEKFSPNVILRGLYQETILPNVAFIGGGGELAYWLQLKSLFQEYAVPFPVLILRNSFVVVEAKHAAFMKNNSLEVQDIFSPVDNLMKRLVTKESSVELSLEQHRKRLKELYNEIRSAASSIDPTLKDHVASLHKKAEKSMQALEKKMYKAEKLKFDARERQLVKFHKGLFPDGELQERIENFMPYYSKYGKEFISELYKASLGLEQKVTVLLHPVVEK